MGDDQDVMGIYSHSTKYEYKAGESGSRYMHGTYWFVCKRNEDIYEVRPLNSKHLPSGLIKLVTKEDFLKFYTPELSYFQDNMLPCLETLQKKIRMGRRYFNLGQLDAAEIEFCQAVLAPEDSEEDTDGLSETYADQRNFSKLRAVLDRLLNVDEVFREKQRHRFNDFGIDLRKKEHYDDAIRFYTKALEVNDLDENLHFNIARVHHAKGQLEDCRRHLLRALEINPEMPEARKFIRDVDLESDSADKQRDKEERGRAAQVRGKSMKRKKAAGANGSTPYDLNF